MTYKLPQAIHSLEQLDAIIGQLERYSEAIRQARIRQTVSKTAGIRVNCPVELEELLRLNDIGLQDEAALLALLTGLAEHRRLAPRVTLILAAYPPEALRLRLVDWLRRNISPAVLLAVRVESGIGGGVIIQTPSHIYDHSFNRLMLENRPKLVELISHV